MRCEFATIAEGLIACRRCGAVRRTAEAPENYFRRCDQPRAKLRGLGDLLASGLAAVGIKKQPGCGCEARQEALNRLFPF